MEKAGMLKRTKFAWVGIWLCFSVSCLASNLRDILTASASEEIAKGSQPLGEALQLFSEFQIQDLSLFQEISTFDLTYESNVEDFFCSSCHRSFGLKVRLVSNIEAEDNNSSFFLYRFHYVHLLIRALHLLQKEVLPHISPNELRLQITIYVWHSENLFDCTLPGAHLMDEDL